MNIKDINTSSADGFVIMRRREVESVIGRILPGLEQRKKEFVDPYNLGQTNTPLFYNRISSISMSYALPSCHRIPIAKQFIDRIAKTCRVGGALACTNAQACSNGDNVHLLHASAGHQTGRSVFSSAPLNN